MKNANMTRRKLKRSRDYEQMQHEQAQQEQMRHEQARHEQARHKQMCAMRAGVRDQKQLATVQLAVKHAEEGNRHPVVTMLRRKGFRLAVVFNFMIALIIALIKGLASALAKAIEFGIVWCWLSKTDRGVLYYCRWWDAVKARWSKI
ncbi:hypothetical protein VNO78_01487 [Psophocarpus tetragonolobus]|uniref:Uncharacterized protein n=1 Tax=Psophocarpus tetragonolobus TaxID=3891 RepID=A0AAN9SZL6_PSOTE